MGTGTWLGLVGASFVITLSSVGAAAPERFGSQGQVVIYHPLLFVSHNDFAHSSQTQIYVAPAASMFVLPNLSLGGRVTWSRSWTEVDGVDANPGNHIGLAPEAGYAIPLGEHFTVWPQAYVGLYYGWSAGQPRSTSLSAGGFVPLLWHPVDHLFLGLGPSAHWSFEGERLGDLEQSFRQLNVGSTFGGYF